MKIKIYFVLFLVYSMQLKGQTKFTKNQILEDLSYLKTALLEAQYDIYESVSETAFEKGFTKIKNQIIKDSLSILEATNTLQQLPVLVNNGHTCINFPGAEYMKYASSDKATIFPLELAFEGDKALIRKNWSNDTGINIGDEILSINGVSIKEILNSIYRQVSGERKMMKNVKIEMYSFPRYYWQIFGQVNNFEIQIKCKGAIKKHSLNSIHVMSEYEDKRSELLNVKMDLKFYNTVAYLNPGSFDGDLENFKLFIKNSFEEIQNKNSKSLIIDLRNNSGGDNVFSDYLVSYIANKPFTWNSSFELRTSRLLKESGKKSNKSKYWQSIFNHKNGQRYSYEFDKIQPQPINNRFKGKVYVLVNRQSHSQATVTAAQIQDYNFGTIVGEETAEFPSLIASVFYFKLPNTGITVQMSKGKMIRVNGSTKHEGVIPDIFIKDYLLDEDDEILTEILKRI